MVQWLGLHTPKADLIPSQGTRSHMQQLTVCMPTTTEKILHATTKIEKPTSHNEDLVQSTKYKNKAKQNQKKDLKVNQIC